MVTKLIRNIWILGGVMLLTNVAAQSSEQILGKPYVALETTAYIDALTTEKPEEVFLPYLQLYRQSYYADGLSIDYNSDVAVYRIMLYDSGYSYNRYSLPLPYDLQWGMTLPQIEQITEIHDPMEGNEFATVLSSPEYTMECYFTSKKLSHIRISATQKTLLENKEALLEANRMRLLPNGTPTEGNVRDGEGTMIWGNGAAVYKGQWSYGLPHGRGQFVDSFGTKYEGDFKLGFFWGQGDFYSKLAGYSYSGAFAMSSKHGQGRIHYTNDVKYQGDWVKDNMHGSGVYSIGDRFLYKGDVVQNALTGKGVVKTPDGTISGTFRNGKPNGICTQTTKDNLQTLTGPFVDGKKNGTFQATILGEERVIVYDNDVEVVPSN